MPCIQLRRPSGADGFTRGGGLLVPQRLSRRRPQSLSSGPLTFRSERKMRACTGADEAGSAGGQAERGQAAGADRARDVSAGDPTRVVDRQTGSQSLGALVVFLLLEKRLRACTRTSPSPATRVPQTVGVLVPACRRGGFRCLREGLELGQHEARFRIRYSSSTMLKRRTPVSWLRHEVRDICEAANESGGYIFDRILPHDHSVPVSSAKCNSWLFAIRLPIAVCCSAVRACDVSCFFPRRAKVSKAFEEKQKEEAALGDEVRWAEPNSRDRCFLSLQTASRFRAVYSV